MTPPTAPASGAAGPDPDPWSLLLPAALVGTARRAVPDTPGLPAPGTADAPAALLDRAALAAVRRRAGYTPHRAEPVEPAPHDDTPQVSEAAAGHLNKIVQKYPDLLPEWLDRVNRAGYRARADNMYGLLAMGARSSDLRPAIAEAVGPRGFWLAQFQKVWHYLHAYGEDEEFDAGTWASGSAGERRRTLAALRRTDPAAARDLVAQALRSGGVAEDRRAFLEVLESGLSTDDEEVLTAALTGDRSAAVRGSALALLARLPESAHAGRLRTYLRELLGIGSGGQLNQGAIVSGRSDLLGDLALAAPDGSEDGEDVRFQRVWELISYAPLDVWDEMDETDDIVQQLMRQTGIDFFAVLANAITVQGSAEWSRNMLNGLDLSDIEEGIRVRRPRNLPLGPLLSPLPAEERCAWARSVLEQGEKPSHSAVQLILDSVPGPWTRELSEPAARMLTNPADNRNYTARSIPIARKISPDLAAELPEDLPGTFPEHVRHEYREVLATIRFRREVDEELSRHTQGAPR